MGKSSGNQTVTQKTQLPYWYSNAAQNAISFAGQAADNIAKPYLGNTVAPVDPLTGQAINLTGQNIGSTNQAFSQAQGGASGVMNYTPNTFLTGNIDAYMTPYIQNVENAALTNMDRAYRQNLNTIGDQAIGAHAFGGSRQGVAEGVAAAENARQMGDLSAQLRSAGFGQASSMMQSDMDRQLQGANLNLQGAGQLGNLAAAGQQEYLRGLQSAIAAGQLNQQQAQALLDQKASQYDAMRNVPLEQLNIMLSALGGTQVPSSSQTKTPTTGNSLISGIGAAGTLASGAAALLPLLGFSDERAKTNIQPLGVDGMTGIPIYAYDYIHDVQQAQQTGQPMPPKRVGPMAQDMPEDMVGGIGGNLVVRGLI